MHDFDIRVFVTIHYKHTLSYYNRSTHSYRKYDI